MKKVECLSALFIPVLGSMSYETQSVRLGLLAFWNKKPNCFNLLSKSANAKRVTDVGFNWNARNCKCKSSVSHEWRERQTDLWVRTSWDPWQGGHSQEIFFFFSAKTQESQSNQGVTLYITATWRQDSLLSENTASLFSPCLPKQVCSRLTLWKRAWQTWHFLYSARILVKSNKQSFTPKRQQMKGLCTPVGLFVTFGSEPTPLWFFLWFSYEELWFVHLLIETSLSPIAF